MTDLKLLQILELYRAKVATYVTKPEPYPHDTLLRTDWDGLKHVWHLMNVMEVFVRDKQMEKAMRWLGFIQGVLWSCRVYDINELKTHNRPDDQEREFLNPDRDLQSCAHCQGRDGFHKRGCPNAAPEEPPMKPEKCALPPEGWECSRPAGHEGPCAASPTAACLDEVERRHAEVLRQHGIDTAAFFPKGTPVKILRGGVYGSDNKMGVVDSHIGSGYGVRLEGTTEVIYAESVEYARPA